MTARITMTVLILALAYTIMPEANAEVSIYSGRYTQHFTPRSYYNEDNDVVQIQWGDGSRFYSAGTFVNSHNVRSYQLGIGDSWKHGRHELGAGASVIYGYEGYIHTLGYGLLVSPGLYYQFNIAKRISFKMLVMPAVYNAGFSYGF